MEHQQFFFRSVFHAENQWVESQLICEQFWRYPLFVQISVQTIPSFLKKGMAVCKSIKIVVWVLPFDKVPNLISGNNETAMLSNLKNIHQVVWSQHRFEIRRKIESSGWIIKRHGPSLEKEDALLHHLLCVWPVYYRGLIHIFYSCPKK